MADITYVRLKTLRVCRGPHGCFSRIVRGWHLSQHLTNAHLEPLDKTHYGRVSRRFNQYLSTAYISTLKHHGIEYFISTERLPLGERICGTFIRTLKEEEVHLCYEDITQARARIGHFITQEYNQKRPHSALGYLTPSNFSEKTCLNFRNFGPN